MQVPSEGEPMRSDAVHRVLNAGCWRLALRKPNPAVNRTCAGGISGVTPMMTKHIEHGPSRPLNRVCRANMRGRQAHEPVRHRQPRRSAGGLPTGCARGPDQRIRRHRCLQQVRCDSVSPEGSPRASLRSEEVSTRYRIMTGGSMSVYSSTLLHYILSLAISLRQGPCACCWNRNC